MLFRNKEKQVLKLLEKDKRGESQTMYFILNDLFQLQKDINNTKSMIDIKKNHIRYLIDSKNKIIKEWEKAIPDFKKSEISLTTKNLVLSFEQVIEYIKVKFIALESYYKEVYK